MLHRGDLYIDTEANNPYPFFFSQKLKDPPESLGDISQWYAEWKWNGIRAQAVRRKNQVLVWSSAETLITDLFPEIRSAYECLPDGTVLDGEILAWKDSEVLSFQNLQTRIAQKTAIKKLLVETPVIFMCFDLLELNGEDKRAMPMSERRHMLTQLLTPGALDEQPSCRAQLNPVLRVSPLIGGSSWDDLAQSRSNSRLLNVEGLMLKRANSKYGVGRCKGDWWEWTTDP